MTPETGIRRRELTWGDVLMVIQALVVVGGGFFFVGSLRSEMQHLSRAVTQLSERLEKNGERTLDFVKSLGALEMRQHDVMRRIDALEQKLHGKQ